MKTNRGMSYTIDPLKGFEGASKGALLDACGLLPYFAQAVHDTAPESVQEAFDGLMECYKFGGWQDGSGWGTIEDMVYKSNYMEDPNMKPLVVFHLTDTIDFLVYQHAITGVTDGEETLMMRMD